jgi:hypothetical protein
VIQGGGGKAEQCVRRIEERGSVAGGSGDDGRSRTSEIALGRGESATRLPRKMRIVDVVALSLCCGLRRRGYARAGGRIGVRVGFDAGLLLFFVTSRAACRAEVAAHTRPGHRAGSGSDCACGRAIMLRSIWRSIGIGIAICI